MALTEERKKYIEELTPLVAKYAKIYGYSPKVVPAIVAQSCYETGYGDKKANIPTIAHNYFGIRHGGINVYNGMTYYELENKLLPTEDIILKPENRKYYWRAYESMDEGVKGYFEFLTEHQPYAKLKDIEDPKEYLLAISRAGYSGGGEHYGNTSIDIMKTNDLIDYCNSILSYSEDFTLDKKDNNSIPAEDTISSDMDLVILMLNNIKKSNNKNQYQENTQLYESTTNIPNTLISSQNSYLEISNNLTESLNKELSIIASIAQCYYDMDNDLANEQTYQTQINEFLSTDITFDINFTSYMFEPNSLVQGATGKVKRTEIEDLLNGNNLTGTIHENFSIAKESARDTINSIEELQNTIANSNRLTGAAWEKVSEKLSEYNEALKLKISLADTLECAMAEALKLILTYLEDYESIDDTKLLETVEAILQAKATIEELKHSINKTQTATKEITDEEGNAKIITFTEYVYSASARESMQNKVIELEQIVEDLTKEVRKQEGLYDIMAQAEQIINDALNEVYSKYATEVSSIVTGNKVSYTSPINTAYTSPLSIPSKLTQVSDQNKIPNGKVSKNDFDNDNTLINTYGTYEDYLNGVEKENNPKYTQTANNGIELSKELSDLLALDPKKNISPKEEYSSDLNNYHPNSKEQYIHKTDSNNDLPNTSDTQEQENNQAPSDSTNTVSNITDSSSSSSNNFYESSEISSSLDNENTSENNQETSTIDTTPSQDNNNTIKDSNNSTIINPDKNEEKEPTSSKDTYYYDNNKKDIFSNNSTSIFKTVGIASATIGAIGATAYGAKKYFEKRKNENDNDNDDSPSSTIDNRSERDNDDTGLDGFE